MLKFLAYVRREFLCFNKLKPLGKTGLLLSGII
jgi:hypothetical protein